VDRHGLWFALVELEEGMINEDNQDKMVMIR